MKVCCVFLLKSPHRGDSNIYTQYSIFSIKKKFSLNYPKSAAMSPGRVVQSVGQLTCKSGVLGSIPGLATYFRFSFRFFKKGSCQLLAKVCARSTG